MFEVSPVIVHRVKKTIIDLCHALVSMHTLLWVLVAFLVVDAIALVWLVSREFVYGSLSSINLSCFSHLVILAGVLVALLTLVWNILKQYSEGLLKESQEFFEKSFDVLNVLDENQRPRNDRIRWLTSARLLKVAEQIGAKIKLKSHKLLYEDIKDFWRSKFYDLLDPDGNGFPENYFAENPGDFDCWSSRVRAPLSLSSIAVLYRFCIWPEGRRDPIHDEPKFSEEEIDRMCIFGPKGLGQILRKHRDLQRDEP